MVFKARILEDQESDEPKARMNRSGTRRVVAREKITDNVQKQTQKATRKNGGEAMSNISTHRVKLCVKQTCSGRTLRKRNWRKQYGC